MSTEILPETFTMPACFVRKTEPFILPIRMTITGCIPMDTNGNHLKKLSYDRVMYINADDHYVYYVRNNENNGTGFDFFSYARNSLCRIDQNGENTKILDKDPCLYASLVGNYIYYLHYDDKDATTLYKIGIDGEGRKKVYSPYIFTCSTLGQYIYTSGTESDGAHLSAGYRQ